MVNISFECGGAILSESNPLDFGTVQAGTTSAIKTVIVKNTGDSDAQQCTIEAKEAKILNGFAVNSQIGSLQETVQAQLFATDSSSGSWYKYGVLGSGKNYAKKVGGTLVNGHGEDSFATKWTPPSNGTAGQKIWGNVFSCVYY